MKKFCLLLLIACLSIMLLAGCGAAAPGGSSMPGVSNSPDKSNLPDENGTSAENTHNNVIITEKDVEYAGPIIDNIFAGIASRDYAVFSRDFSEATKSALTKEAFDSLVSFLESKIGDYKSKSFGQAANVTQNGTVYTVVIYTAEYSDEPGGVLVTVAFSGLDGEKKVEQLYFNSPKLREQ